MAYEEDFFGLGFGFLDDEFFALPAIDPLSDFSIDCEGTDIDTLIRTLEETEKLSVDSSCGLFNQKNSTANIDIVNAKCKSTTKLKVTTDDKVVLRRNKKRKGISLLAKPSNFREKKEKGKSISPTRFATYFYEDHNYCPRNSSANNCTSNFSINETMVTDNKSLHSLDAFDYLNGYESISLEIESEVIMNLEVENAIDEFCESVNSNDDLNKELVYSSNSESESMRASSVNEINLETLDDTDKEMESSMQVNCDVRNGKSTKVFRVRQLSTRSSVCSSRSSSVSSTYSSCSSCCSRETNRCRSRSPSHDRVRSRSRSVSSHDSRRNKFRRKRSWRKESGYANNTYSKKGESCSEDRKSWFLDRRKESVRDVEERRIVYVGNIPDGTTKTDLRYWFAKFGPITQVSVHFRDYGNNYAFVTFQRRADAYEAVQRGNEDSRHPVFDLSFGGRRNFCKNRYEDLDRMEKDKEISPHNMDFDSLLRSTKTRYRQ